MYQVPVRFSSESGSDRRGGFWLNRRFGGRERRVRPRGRRSRRYLLYAGLLVGFCVLLAFAGCGGIAGNGQLIAAVSGVNFGAVTVGRPTTTTVSFSNTGSGAVDISSVSVTGGPFALVSPITYPLTVAGGATYSFQVEFNPSAAGQANGQITVYSNAAATPPAVSLTGLGVNAAATAPSGALSGISCSNSSLVGAATDNCFVALNGPAGSGGATISLESSSSTVAVPATVTVPANTTGVGFAVNAAAVGSEQTVVLTASAGGVSESVALQLNAALRYVSASASQLSFGTVAVNSSAAESLVLTSSGTEAVTIGAVSLAGAGFSIGEFALPVTLNPGQSAVLNVEFKPSSSGSVNGQLTLTTNGSGQDSLVIGLTGTASGTSGGGSSGGSGPGATPVPSVLSCSSATMTGAGMDSCNVTLSAAAPANGTKVTLTSGNPAVSVPASATVTGGAIGVSFTATASAVTAEQTATLTASANGGSQSFVLQLNAAGAVLSASQASLTFGNVSLNGLGAQALTLISTGTQAVTITAAQLAGSAFSLSGISVPVTLNPGQSVALQVEFLPSVAGIASGQITIASNATTGGTLIIPLSGTGAIPYAVSLSWAAPASSSDAVAGYNVYRSLNGTPAYQRVNTAVNILTAFTDATVENGQSYVYYVTSVDSSGNESAPSNSFNVAIP